MLFRDRKKTATIIYFGVFDDFSGFGSVVFISV